MITRLLDVEASGKSVTVRGTGRDDRAQHLRANVPWGNGPWDNVPATTPVVGSRPPGPDVKGMAVSCTEASMNHFSVKRVVLAAAAFTFGILGAIERSESADPLAGFISGDFPITTSTANAVEARGMVRRASCPVVRLYVAKYGAPVAEAWARNKGANEADIQTARRCISPQQTAQVGHATDRAF